jgi:DNA-directed RNA polymerase subunit M/transcription elongation factor TFIIS
MNSETLRKITDIIYNGATSGVELNLEICGALAGEIEQCIDNSQSGSIEITASPEMIEIVIAAMESPAFKTENQSIVVCPHCGSEMFDVYDESDDFDGEAVFTCRDCGESFTILEIVTTTYSTKKAK